MNFVFQLGLSVFLGYSFPTAIANGSFERVCVLFNIAALQSQIAAAQNMNSDDGLKTTAKLFQVLFRLFVPLLRRCSNNLCSLIIHVVFKVIQ